MTSTECACTVPLIEIQIDDELDPARLAETRVALERILSLCPHHLVMDVARCAHLDAAALDLLLHVHRKLTEHGAVLTLRNPTARVRRILGATGLARVLPVTTTGDAATPAMSLPGT